MRDKENKATYEHKCDKSETLDNKVNNLRKKLQFGLEKKKNNLDFSPYLPQYTSTMQMNDQVVTYSQKHNSD